MKTIHLFSSLFFPTTVWASPTHPLVFFAKVDGDYVPLSSIPHGQSDWKLRALSYGDSSAPPVEFTLLDGDLAVTNDTSTPGYAGFFDNVFVFGPRIVKKSLALDEQKKITVHKLFSCPIRQGSGRVISIQSYDPACFKVDVQLMSYHGNTHPVVNESPMSKKADPNSINADVSLFPKGKHDVWHQRPTMSSEEPFVFFAKWSGIMIPLSSQMFPKFSSSLSVLSYGINAVKPTEYFLRDDIALVISGIPPGYIGFHADAVVHSIEISPDTHLVLDTKNRVRNHNFFSCKNKFNQDQVIAFKKTHRSCFKVELYILKYDRETGSAKAS